MRINSAKDLQVYQKGYALAMKVFHLSKSFPAEERNALPLVCQEVGKMLGSMINNPGPFLI
jgi:hypothetical protein